MRDGRSAVCSFAKLIYCLRSVGREPGRLASSTRSCRESSLEMRRSSVIGLSTSSSAKDSAAPVAECEFEVGEREDGAEGWEMEF